MTGLIAMVFVERKFEIGERELICRFDLPTITPRDIAPNGEYRCDYAIIWPDRERRSYAVGVDSIQALMLAMSSVFSDLECSEEYKTGQLFYLGELVTTNWGWHDGPPLLS
jgi:hypothetical protein